VSEAGDAVTQLTQEEGKVRETVFVQTEVEKTILHFLVNIG
jgi:hypothetical protein